VSSEDAPAKRNKLPDSAADAQRLDAGPQTDARAAAGPPPPASAASPVQPATQVAGGREAAVVLVSMPLLFVQCESSCA